MAYEVISGDRTMTVPQAIARCPICGADLYLSFDQWDLEDDGTWTAAQSGCQLDCSMEPDIEGDDWELWHDGHYAMPYVDWLPVQYLVWRWVQASCRFDMARDEEKRLEQLARFGKNP